MTTHRIEYNGKTYAVTWKLEGNRREIVDLDVRIHRAPRVMRDGASYFRRVPRNGVVWNAIEDQLNH